MGDVPRKGNVDRNQFTDGQSCGCGQDVPRKGNVDRNADQVGANMALGIGTFPARGTWIEM